MWWVAKTFTRLLRPLAIIAVLAGISLPALATPPDMVCSGEKAGKGFEIRLTTISGMTTNEHSIVALSIHHSKITVGPLDEGAGLVDVAISGEDVKGQWLDDGRVDLHIYREHTTPFPRLVSIDLKIRTKSTGKRDEDSGHLIHKGDFSLLVYTGSRLKGSNILFSRTRGQAECR